MSFVHASIVGHFETFPVYPQGLAVSRPVDAERVRRLLSEFGDDVARCVTIENGYAFCEWSAGHAPRERVMAFAERLADDEGCAVLETPPWRVRYPPEWVEREAEAIQTWLDAGGDPRPGALTKWVRWDGTG